MILSLLRKIFSPTLRPDRDMPNAGTAPTTAHSKAQLLQEQDTYVVPAVAPTVFDASNMVGISGGAVMALPIAPNTSSGGPSTAIDTTRGPLSGPTQAKMEALAHAIKTALGSSSSLSLGERHQEAALRARLHIFSELPKCLPLIMQRSVVPLSDSDRQHLLALAQMTATYDAEILRSGGMSAYDHAEAHMQHILARIEMLPEAPRTLAYCIVTDLQVLGDKLEYATDSPYLLYSALIILQRPEPELQKLAHTFLYFNAKLFNKALDPKTRLHHESIQRGQSNDEELHLDINRGIDQIDMSSRVQFNYDPSARRRWTKNQGLPASDAIALKPWLESFHAVRERIQYAGQDTSYTLSYLQELSKTLQPPKWRQARVKCGFTDPLNRFLPADMALKAKDQLQSFDAHCAANPSFKATPGLKEEADTLRGFMLTAQRMDTHSRADGVIWEQIAYLLWNDSALCDLNALIILSCKNLRREIALDDLLHGDSEAPSKTPQPSTKKERKKARKKAEAKPLASAQASVHNTEPHTRPVSTHQEVSAHLAQDFKTVFYHATRTPRFVIVAGVNLYTRLSQGQLQRCLLNFVEPSSFLHGRNPEPNALRPAEPPTDEAYIAASAASVAYHLAKHAPGSTVEAYIGEAMAFYNSDFKEKRARVSDGVYAPATKVRFMYTQNRFATYSEDGRFITYCNRNTCNKNHYSKVIEET